MTDCLGKKFEAKVKSDWDKIHGAVLERLYDVAIGYATVSNVADFVGYYHPTLYYIECKTTQGNTLNFAQLTQYDKLIERTGIYGVVPGVVLWFYDHDIVCFIHINEIKKMKENGCKSVNVKMLDGEFNGVKYDILKIPSKKKRTYMDSDYTVLFEKYKMEGVPNGNNAEI